MLSNFRTYYRRELSRVVDSSRSLLRSRYGTWFLAIMAFADSALALPIATDPFMVAYILANRSRALLGVVVTSVASVLGGVVAYLIAALFIDMLLTLLSPEAVSAFRELTLRLDEGTFLIAFFGAFTPLPYALIALTTGAMKGNLLLFIAGSLLGRILRFGIVGYFTYRYGQMAVTAIARHLTLVTVLTVLGVLLYFGLRMWV